MVEEPFREKIRFLGRQSHIESIINIFHIGVLFAHQEGLSNSIIEYMALEKPVIASKGGGTGEIVESGKTGFLVNPQRIDEMAEKIEYLLDNRSIACSMGRAGKEKILKDFSQERMIHSFIMLYKNLLNEH